MSKITKSQHYVPRFILKHFVENNEQIWVFDKQKNEKFKTNIKNISAENRFYDFSIQGANMSLEQYLSHIETKTSKLIKKIINDESLVNINDEEKIIISRFIALQFTRVKQWRDMYKNAYESFGAVIKKKAFNPENIRGYKELTDEDIKIHHIYTILNAEEDLASHFLNKIWILQKTTKNNPFWISDNPISLQNMNNFGYHGSIGLAVKGIEISFPLTKRLSLWLLCPSHKEKIDILYLSNKLVDGNPIPLRPENVVNHNSLQVIYATRFIFSSNEDFSLAEAMIKSHSSLREGPKMKVW